MISRSCSCIVPSKMTLHMIKIAKVILLPALAPRSRPHFACQSKAAIHVKAVAVEQSAEKRLTIVSKLRLIAIYETKQRALKNHASNIFQVISLLSYSSSRVQDKWNGTVNEVQVGMKRSSETF